MGSYRRSNTSGRTGPIGEPGPPQPVKPELVDLGLPSGTLWARSNLGAIDETARGLFFSWGNKEGHEVGDGYEFSDPNYALTPGSKISGDITWVDDPVFAVYGGNWSMASRDLFSELLAHTSSEWVRDYKGSGVNGRLLTSLVNEEQLFFPASGFMDGLELTEDTREHLSWLSTYDRMNSSYRLFMSSSQVSMAARARFRGLSIRPIVRGSLPPVVPPSSFQSLNFDEDE